MKKRSIRWIAVGAILGGVLASSSNSPVQADTFYPLPGKPAVTVSYTDSLAPGTNKIEVVTATIGLNATVGDLETVVLCAYKPSEAGGLSEFDATPGTDPTIDSVRLACNGSDHNRIKIVWTESSSGDSFAAAEGGTLGAGADLSTATTGAFSGTNGAYVSGIYNQAAQALQVTFKFKVGPAALAGDDWVISVAANYPDNVCATGGGSNCTEYSGFVADDLVGSGAETDVSAAYYQVVNTGGTRGRLGTYLDFEYLKDGQTSPEVTSEEDEITYTSNDYSTLTLRGTDFGRWDPAANEDAGAYVEGDTLTLHTESTTVPSGRVAIDCRDFSASVATMFRVNKGVNAAGGTSLVHTRDASTSTEQSAQITCTLTYGGGAQVALQEYSNTVTVGLAQTSAPAPS